MVSRHLSEIRGLGLTATTRHSTRARARARALRSLLTLLLNAPFLNDRASAPPCCCWRTTPAFCSCCSSTGMSSTTGEAQGDPGRRNQTWPGKQPCDLAVGLGIAATVQQRPLGRQGQDSRVQWWQGVMQLGSQRRPCGQRAACLLFVEPHAPRSASARVEAPLPPALTGAPAPCRVAPAAPPTPRTFGWMPPTYWRAATRCAAAPGSASRAAAAGRS